MFSCKSPSAVSWDDKEEGPRDVLPVVRRG
jgi:hypothetical protein